MSTTPIPRSDLLYPTGPAASLLLTLHEVIDHLSAGAKMPETVNTNAAVDLARWSLHQLGVWQAADPAGRVPVVYVETKADELHAIISDHRRQRNVRACGGCDWSPVPLGDSSDPEAVARRHDQFNTHVTNLIIKALVGAP